MLSVPRPMAILFDYGGRDGSTFEAYRAGWPLPAYFHSAALSAPVRLEHNSGRIRLFRTVVASYKSMD